jgi:hypothetical protein
VLYTVQAYKPLFVPLQVYAYEGTYRTYAQLDTHHPDINFLSHTYVRVTFRLVTKLPSTSTQVLCTYIHYSLVRVQKSFYIHTWYNNIFTRALLKLDTHTRATQDSTATYL